MADREVQELRLQAVKDLLSQSDIEQLYGRDQATLENLRSLAERAEIPNEVDEAVSTVLAEYDVDLEGVDPLVKPALQVLFLGARVKGWELRERILRTKVREWIIEAPPAKVEVRTPSASIYISSCHGCGRKFDEKRYICPDCGALVNGR